MRSSEIDAAVRLHQSSHHEYAFVVRETDKVAVQICIRCGRLYEDIVAEEPKRPCRGLIG